MAAEGRELGWEDSIKQDAQWIMSQFQKGIIT